MPQDQEPFITDTAEEKSLREKAEPQKIRNDAFDSIVNTGIECHVALRVDVIDKPTNRHLFCGQVGKIENVDLSDSYEDHYLVTFIDYKKDHDEFARCFVKKKDLLPLFCFAPDIYRNYKRRDQTLSINQIRDSWELFQFDVAPQSELTSHKKVSTRFKIGRLVTIQVNFQQELSDGTSFTIQAGQTGVISQLKDTDYVEVTFWSIPFGILAVTRKKLVSSSLPSFLENNFDPLNSANSSWKKKISIHKDFLFPLYVQNLDVNDLDENNL